jgi:hypothetical protein
VTFSLLFIVLSTLSRAVFSTQKDLNYLLNNWMP